MNTTRQTLQPDSRSSIKAVVGAGLVLAGSLTVALALLFYFREATNIIIISPETSAVLNGLAEITLVSFSLGLLAVLFGVHILFQQEMSRIRSGLDSSQSWLSTLTIVLSSRFYNTLFIVGALVYGVIFALFSGALVYQASPNFSQEYMVSVPSILVTTCCGPVGQTPSAVVYLTEHLGILLVPVNVLLLVGTAWLVGANVCLLVYAYRKRVDGRMQWLGSFGAVTGLFTACPTCASLFLFGSLGAGGAVAVILLPAQVFLVASTDLLLVANLVLASKRIAKSQTCVIRR